MFGIYVDDIFGGPLGKHTKKKPGTASFFLFRKIMEKSTNSMFQLSSTHAYFNVDAVCNTELQTDVINRKNAGNTDLVFKRNNIEYMKVEGTQQAVEITQGTKSNTYDSIGNADVSFRRNTRDFMYL